MDRDRYLTTAALLTGLLVAACGLLVISGWLLGNVHWIQTSPDAVPMQFNTALCFLALGTAAVCHTLGARPASRMASAGAIGLLLATGAQMVTGVNLGIDEAIVAAQVITNTSSPGRMAPNSLLCLLLAGTALVALTVPGRHNCSVAAVMASLSGGLAMTALFGYLTDTRNAYAWGALTHMAVPTAVLLLALTGGITAAAWAPAARKRELPVWLPFPAAAFALAITLGCWSAMSAAGHLSPLPGAMLLVFGLATTGAGPVAVALYVALQRRTAQMERMSLDRYRSLALTAASVVWEAEPNGSFRASTSWQEHTGQAADAQLGTGWLQMVHEEDRMAVKSAWFDALLGGTALDTRCRVFSAQHNDYSHVALRAVPVRDEQQILEWIGTLSDEHAAVTANRALHEARGKYEQAFRMNPDAMFLLDLRTLRMVDANASFNRVLGYTLADFAPSNERLPRLWADAEERARFQDELRQNSAVSEAPARMQRKTGELIDTLMSAQTVTIEELRFLLCIVRDVTAERAAERDRLRLQTELTEANARLEESNEKLRKMTVMDALTGVANRRAFDLRLAEELRRSTRQREPLSLLLCDIDCFKQYNDHYGHVAGDTCLQQVATTAQACFQRASDLIARYGGEEFVVILPQADANHARSMANRLLEAIRSAAIPHAWSAAADHVTVSMGVVTLTDTAGWKPQQVVECVDQALYAAKEAGRDRLSVALPDPGPQVDQPEQSAPRIAAAH